MTRIGVRDLRQNASRYVALVKAGETIEVTERGRLVALLTPPQNSQSVREELIAAGRLIPASPRSGRRRAPQPVLVDESKPTNRELLDSERDERL
ncbi:MAG: type II toxin-antitoxin system Phd/YefM family antitoxin [Actinomycetes bacterium]